MKVMIAPLSSFRTYPYNQWLNLLHHNRTWTVLKGTVRIKTSSKVGYYTAGDTAYAYKTNPYGIENVGFVVAELLEIRMGEYLEDDDIILIEGQS